MIPITFLSARVPLVKQIDLSKTLDYPVIKKFTSFTHEVSDDREGLREFHRLMVEHASKGHCLYKGELKQPLMDESRAKQTKTNEPNQLLVIDIDKYPLSITNQNFDRQTLAQIAEQLVRKLPTQLHHVSYIAQASASLGTKPDTVSLHLFFFLDKPVAPQSLKWWLTSVNLFEPDFETKLKLQPTGRSLHYVVDRCMAENSRIIYIAPPQFNGMLNNPFKNDTDRIILIEKDEPVAHLSRAITVVNPQTIQNEAEAKVKNLRDAKGLDTTKARIKMTKVGQGQEQQVLTNPDRAVMHYSYHNQKFCYANLNDGDSNAYYWPLDNPKWVYNFKDEPLFEMAKVDSDFYKWYLEEFKEFLVKNSNTKPLVFRDFETDAYYTVEYDPLKEQMVRFAIASRTSLSDFCEQYWEPIPDPIPTWDVFFDPQDTGGISLEERKLNLFAPTIYMEKDVEIGEGYKGVEYGDAAPALEMLTPNIYKIIKHMLGDGEREIEHFINWLAFVFTRKEKTNIAWIMHGIEGTGKGLFYTRVLRPLFGMRYAVMKRMVDLEDKYDGWREYNLITVVDEFRLADTTMTSRMYDQIKNMISEPYGTVRYMRTNPKEVPLHSNYLFFSNNEDAMRMSIHDRRFCLGLRQTTKIDMVYDMHELLRGTELELLAFATFLKEFQVDEAQARVALDNDAKQQMREASNSWVDDFCAAVKRGDFAFFMESVMYFKPTNNEDSIIHSRCCEALSQWLLDFVQSANDFVHVNVEDLRMVYALNAGKQPKPAEFGKVLSRRGIVAERMRVNGTVGRWAVVKFDFADYDPMELVATYGTPAQQAEAAQQRTH